MKKIFLNIIFAILLVSCFSCKQLNQMQEQPVEQRLSAVAMGSKSLAYIYNPNAQSLHPKVIIKNNYANEHEVLILLNDQELLFNSANQSNSPIARLKIFCKIVDNYENYNLLDTMTRIIVVNKQSTNRLLQIKFPLKKVENQKFVVQTTITDLNRGRMSLNFNEIDNQNKLDVNNYYFRNYPQMQMISEEFAIEKDTVFFEHFNRNSDTLYIKVYPSVNTPALLPFASDPNFGDSLDFSNSKKISYRYLASSDTSSLLVFRQDSLDNQGVAFAFFDRDFPMVNLPKNMILPVRYLCNEKEFLDLQNALNQKLALDNFWLSCTKDTKKAKELIKVYYSRAMFANMYFSDYKMGMLTDRGMIFMLFGPPTELAKRTDKEIWTYYSSKGLKNIKFTFNKKISMYGGYEYKLYRQTDYKTAYDKAVSYWRSGSIYTYGLK